MSTHPDSYRQLKDNPSLVAEIVRQEQALNGSVVTYFPKDQLSYPPYKLNIIGWLYIVYKNEYILT